MEVESESVSTDDQIKTDWISCNFYIHPKSNATLKAKVTRPVVQGKAETREADVIKDIKRGSMKDKWGLNLSYRRSNYSLELVVTKVAMFSPADKVGLQVGNTITRVNDWKIEAIDHLQAALGILLAGGFIISLGWL